MASSTSDARRHEGATLGCTARHHVSVTRIGILTGGGDVPGLNSIIKSVVYRGWEIGWETVGIRRGWKGLTHLGPAGASDGEFVIGLNREKTRAIDRTGGTVLHTSRTNPARMKADTLPPWLDDERRRSLETDDGRYDLTPLVLDNITRLGLTHLIAIGGDDTLGYADRLSKEGVALVAIPKTMDNDVQGTEYCVGFSTAVTRAKELINRQRTTLGSHERIGIFRIFGRNSGYSAWYAAYVSSTRCVIPEAPFELDKLATLLTEDRDANPSRYAMVIASEGAAWAGGTLQEYGDPRRGAAPAHGGRDGAFRPHLRPAQRRSRCARPDGRHHLRQCRG
jgi:6-phosphofructokinase